MQAAAHGVDSFDLQVVVVDNASCDGSAEMTASEFPQVRLLASRENLGFTRANNLALRELGFSTAVALPTAHPIQRRAPAAHPVNAPERDVAPANARPDYVLLLNPDAEVIDDALAALALLRRTPGVDPRRVYLLGHSLGAWLAPVIAAEDGRVAGVILMAAPARPLEQLYVEQIRYLLSLDPDASAAGKAKLEDAEREAAAVRQIRETGQGPERALGAPRSYWLSFRGLDPLAAAARLPAPVFVLQGGRDYQVTGEDFRLWQRALEGKAGAQLKLYPALNHLFQPGEGPSSPAEYDKPGHVAAEVIGDLCQWILRTGGPAQRPATSPPR
jgi:dienelactone hydrolase